MSSLDVKCKEECQRDKDIPAFRTIMATLAQIGRQVDAKESPEHRL